MTYRSAGLDYNDTAYFEAHGTGTAAGDPIECAAIAATISAGRTKENPLLVGSIKTNIGHMEGSSGIAGLIKAVFSLERALIPPNLWFEHPNPRIPMDEWGIEVIKQFAFLCIVLTRRRFPQSSANGPGEAYDGQV